MIEDFNDLLDMRLGDVLDNFVFLYSCECGYVYGICKADDVDKLYEDYDLSDYAETVSVEPMVSFEVMDTDVLDWDRLVEMMDNLGVPNRNL